MRRSGIPIWLILTTALLAGAIAIAVSKGQVIDAIVVGLMLLVVLVPYVVLVVLAVGRKRRSKKT
ncbi:MAG: hypothetical protein WAU75_21335 [Solirubrobacteraceae bacterium]